MLSKFDILTLSTAKLYFRTPCSGRLVPSDKSTYVRTLAYGTISYNGNSDWYIFNDKMGLGCANGQQAKVIDITKNYVDLQNLYSKVRFRLSFEELEDALTKNRIFIAEHGTAFRIGDVVKFQDETKVQNYRHCESNKFIVVDINNRYEQLVLRPIDYSIDYVFDMGADTDITPVFERLRPEED